jgi:hypothetical protein
MRVLLLMHMREREMDRSAIDDNEIFKQRERERKVLETDTNTHTHTQKRKKEEEERKENS